MVGFNLVVRVSPSLQNKVNVRINQMCGLPCVDSLHV
jgi:hypothetical protein